MKTSKIILISILATIIIWITAVFFTATSKIKQLLKETGFEQTDTVNTVNKGKTFKLENFSVAVVSGKGKITIEQSDKNSFQCFSDNQILPEIKNDTLFLPADNDDNYVNAVKLNTVILTDKVKADISDFKTDTFNIQTSEKSEANLNDLKIKVLNILTEGKSSVKLYDINGCNIETKLVLKDKSKIYIDNSDNLNLSLKKDSEAKLEISN